MQNLIRVIYKIQNIKDTMKYLLFTNFFNHNVFLKSIFTKAPVPLKCIIVINCIIAINCFFHFDFKILPPSF